MNILGAREVLLGINCVLSRITDKAAIWLSAICAQIVKECFNRVGMLLLHQLTVDTVSGWFR